MKTLAITVLGAGAVAAALGSVATAAAFPNAGTVEDTIGSLKAEGYRGVQLNGSTNNSPLSRCIVTGTHPLLAPTATLVEKQNTTVFVDISCPVDR